LNDFASGIDTRQAYSFTRKALAVVAGAIAVRGTSYALRRRCNDRVIRNQNRCSDIVDAELLL
jgi:hypothetical protein